MNLPYIKGSLEAVLIKAASQFPGVFVSGPRQSGKTTLLRQLFGGSYRYVSLESPAIHEEEPHHVQAGRSGVITP